MMYDLFFFSLVILCNFAYHCSTAPIPIDRTLGRGASDPLYEFDEIFQRAAATRLKAATVTQSINNWIEDVDTVNRFLNVGLNLPISVPPKNGAAKALAFAKDEPVNVKLLKATPRISADGLAAAATLEKVFGDVLEQLGNVVDQPLSLPVALNAVGRINVNKYSEFLRTAQFMIEHE